MHNFDENEVLRDVLSGLNEEVPPMPEELHAAWMQKVEDDQVEKTLNRKAFTRFLSIAAALVFVVGGTLLTRDSMEDSARLNKEYQALVEENDSLAIRATTANEFKADLGSYDSLYGAATASAPAAGATMMMSARSAMPEAAEEEGIAFDSESDVPAAEEKKIIRTARLTIYTQTFDTSLENLRALCEADGGWIESSSESTNSRTSLRTANLTLRLPQEALDGYLAGADQLGRITSRSETATDVTASYQDTQTRLATQVALMDRLQALITESGDLSDLLALEAQIADTQYQIDALTTSLNRTDRQAAYSTVTISLYEETAPAITDTTVSLGERISAALHMGWDAFTDFCQDMLVFVTAALPFIAIVVVLVIALAIIRKVRRNKK